MKNKNDAGTFNGIPIAWWYVPESVCYLVFGDDNPVFDHDIVYIGDSENPDRWMFDRFSPSGNDRGYVTHGSENGTLKEMQDLFLLDLKKLESPDNRQIGDVVMKSKDVNVGDVYSVRLASGQRVDARIDGVIKNNGGWNAFNLGESKKFKITNVRQIIGAPQGITVESAEPEPEGETPEAETTPKAERKKTAREDGTMSGVDAAAAILYRSGGPLGVQELVSMAAEQGIWKPAGLTPGATLYSAILREIKVKGDKSRFVKVARGKFKHSES